MNKKLLALLFAGIMAFSTTACDMLGGSGSSGKISSVVVNESNIDSLTYKTARVYSEAWYDTQPAPLQPFDSLGMTEDDIFLECFWGPWEEGYYNGSYFPELRVQKTYNDLAEMGCNVLFQGNDDYADRPQAVLNSLQFCQNAGVSLLIGDKTLAHIDHFDPTEPASKLNRNQQDWNDRLALFKQYESFGGLYVVDEPDCNMFDIIEEGRSYFENALEANGMTKKWYYVNCFPRGYVITHRGQNSVDYYKGMIEATGKTYLSYDCYPFCYGYPNDFQAGNFMGNVEEVYKITREKNVCLYGAVQVGGNWTEAWDDHTGVRPPTMSQCMWECNMFLAYGAKGLEVFPGCIPHSYYYTTQNLDEFGEPGTSGVLDPYGNKTKYWYAYKNTFDQVQAIEKELVHCNQVGIIQVGHFPGDGDIGSTRLMNGTERAKGWRQLTNFATEGDMMVACFSNGGKTRLMVVNNDYLDSDDKKAADRSDWNALEGQSTAVTLNFDDTYCFDVTQRAQKASVVGNALTLKLAGGEMAWIELR